MERDHAPRNHPPVGSIIPAQCLHQGGAPPSPSEGAHPCPSTENRGRVQARLGVQASSGNPYTSRYSWTTLRQTGHAGYRCSTAA